ncbi:grasp-with-spasm system ATP-grasp peptide maturase [Chryseobacterium indologenes]|uniref:grasp-with-spasm system ATP-grasp peptide maturase n=1 Tax=Chryseobacterium indologenes TaxID=253 RepID=UPI001108FC60|nr:grasp-with-spasm system ATP-grasp peptide maturase [Chryseobacterium indologenes]TLX25123.1 grasp-with-spasm system ATP-grasp peptide maturase [Chryseobacterium indologenes]
MILLFSQDQFEYTTDIIFEWVQHLGGNVRRVNGKELIENKHTMLFSNSSNDCKFNDINLSQVNAIWYRRWLNSEYTLNRNKKVNSYLRKEFHALTQYFFSYFQENKWYNRHDYFQEFLSKTEQLSIAKEVGFRIPDTLITNNKNDLISFLKKHESIIVKPISDVESFYDKSTKKLMGTFTARITEDYIKANISVHFFPSLFQAEIKKKYELRIFYDKGHCYPMAIFSSKNEKTSVDFRQYDNQLPNRNVPFKLTSREKYQIKRFMKKSNLETGSLDIICSRNNELFFLEVNPLGQFGMVSNPCNYYIEKKIANNLIQKDNENK